MLLPLVSAHSNAFESHNSLWCDQNIVDKAIHEIGDALMHQSADKGSSGASLLALSGGGSRGSWGAGFLVGWQSQREQPRNFDLVTGVSVGALLSTYAYIADYAGMKTVMENIRSKDVYRQRVPLLWPLYATSKFHNGRLHKTLDATIGPAQLEAVAQRPQPGLLCVATVEIGSGELVKWNLTGIAEKFIESRTDEERHTWLELYHQVLVAATSVPGAFPPQKIVMPEFNSDQPLPFTKVSWHIDAGVRTQVFGDVGSNELVNLYADFLTMVESMDKDQHLAPAEIVMIINSSDEVDRTWSPPKYSFLSLFKLAARSITLILNQTAKGSREKLIEGVRHKLGEPGEGRWHLHIASMSQAELLDCGALDFSCAGRYFQEGEDRGRELNWDQSSVHSTEE